MSEPLTTQPCDGCNELVSWDMERPVVCSACDSDPAMLAVVIVKQADAIARLRSDAWLERAAEEIAALDTVRDIEADVLRMLKRHRDGR